MMVHPYPVDSVAPLMLANAHFSVRYTGKEAHASAYPELGINAADALTVAQVAIGLLRQHIHPTDRVHGIVTRAARRRISSPLRQRHAISYVPRRSTTSIRSGLKSCVALKLGHSLPARNWRSLAVVRLCAGVPRSCDGRPLPPQCRGAWPGFSRLGRSTAAQWWLDRHGERVVGAALHSSCNRHQLIASGESSAGFTAHCITEAADRAISDGALAMAWTAIDIATDADLRQRLLSRA